MSSSKISQLQLLQQNLQNILFHKQQLQNSMVEFESALHELKNTEKCYKIVGHLMIASSKDKLSEELESKKEVSELRLKNYLLQEEKLKKSIEELQKEVVKELQDHERSAK